MCAKAVVKKTATKKPVAGKATVAKKGGAKVSVKSKSTAKVSKEEAIPTSGAGDYDLVVVESPSKAKTIKNT